MSRKAPIAVPCPACQAEIRFRKAPYVGQYKFCADCDAELEVVSLSPATVNLLDDTTNIYENEANTLESFNFYEEEKYAEYEPVRTERIKRPVSLENSFDFYDR